jgi:hypothetical protein
MGKQRILLVDGDAKFSEVFARALGRALAAESFDVAFVGPLRSPRLAPCCARSGQTLRS